MAEFPYSDQFYFNQAGMPTITFASLEYSGTKGPQIKTIEREYHTFAELQQENIIDKDSHSVNDNYAVVEKSNNANHNFEKLFKVLLGVLESYN
jgi:hypothetical protein